MPHCKLSTIRDFSKSAMQPHSVFALYSHAPGPEATVTPGTTCPSNNAVWNMKVPLQTWLLTCQQISRQLTLAPIGRVVNRQFLQRLLQICPTALLGWVSMSMTGILMFHFEHGTLIMPPLGDGLPLETSN
jgi:hypothetical protein